MPDAVFRGSLSSWLGATTPSGAVCGCGRRHGVPGNFGRSLPENRLAAGCLGEHRSDQLRHESDAAKAKNVIAGELLRTRWREADLTAHWLLLTDRFTLCSPKTPLKTPLFLHATRISLNVYRGLTDKKCKITNDSKGPNGLTDRGGYIYPHIPPLNGVRPRKMTKKYKDYAQVRRRGGVEDQEQGQEYDKD